MAGEQHTLIQAPIRDEISEDGPRQAGCSCTGRMIASAHPRSAYWDFYDHLKAQELAEDVRERLLDEAWETLTGKKN